MTTTGDQFFRLAGQNNEYVAFATLSNLRRLCSADLVSMDGTFDTVPRRYFCQLFTMHTFEQEKLVPLVYVLMVNKTAALYETFFNDLRAECQQHGLQFDPPSLLSDFETGLISAVSRVFPLAKHRGCHFHFCQVSYGCLNT